MKKLLMLGTIYGSILMLEYAKSIGVHTIVTDFNEPEHSPGKLISDEYWMINTGDLDALEAKCREEGIDAVVCGISEFNLEMCMELCRRLGLQCYCTPEAWHYSRDKVDFKALCRELGAPLATDYFISDPPTREELDKIQYPVVVKPIDLDTMQEKGSALVAVDTVGAGIGEVVMTVAGSSSRQTAVTDGRPVDCSIIAIIDHIDIDRKRVFDKFE